MLNLNPLSLRPVRWGAVATAVAAAAATAAVLCVPATQAVVVGGVESASSGAPVSARTDDFSWGSWGDPRADKVSLDGYGANQAHLDPGSMYTVGNAIGARGLWAMKDGSGRPLTGQGVGVAVLDSGVDQVAGLSEVGKVTYGPDLSIEGNGVLTHKDTFGHGTFMAGIIAGRESTGPSSGLSTAKASVQLGVAPDAKILALKLATTDGSTDVSQVIAALDWVTQNPVQPDGTRVRVINLSYGTDSAQSYLTDPLAAAAENAWRHGIVVVVSGGNNGSVTGRLTNPAIDPYVIAVGATDSNLNVRRWSSEETQVAGFSQVGSSTRHVDLVAPGTSLVSLRAPGSFIDLNNPLGRVAGDLTGTLFRGSGTSQAAAVVSGSVALLLQAYPTLTPDQVKYALTSTADPISGASTEAAGAGTLDLTKAYETAGALTGTPTSSWGSRISSSTLAPVQAFPKATGLGSIDAARGGSGIVDADGIDLIGEVDVLGNKWRPAAWWLATSNLSAWSDGKWMGSTWTGDNWEPESGGLTSARWSSARWSSARWSTADWSSARWSSARWSSARWSSARWSSARWSELFG
jgi:serine protease AprX